MIIIFNINFSFSQVDLRTCGYACTSNNYTLTDVYLSLSAANGDPITNTTCTIGQVQQVYIYLNYSSNSNSSISFARLNTDLIINGVPTFLNVLLGTIVPGSNKKLIYGPFNWTCGDELILSNSIIAWKTSPNNDPGPNYNCGSYSNSQCDFTNSFTISKPLAVQFTYKACKVGTNTTVAFTSTTNGGKTPYTFAWDFRNDGGAPDSTSPNPTFTYTTSNNTAKLTVTDAQNISNSYIVPIVEPNELMLSETHPNIGCTGGLTTITLTPTGGTPNYTYSWNTGATTKDLPNVGPGNYTVTVTDSNNCIKQLSVNITSGDSTKPVVNPLPAPSTINCPDTPVFDVATATDNSGTVSSLTFVDVNTPGSCAGTYSITRTWTAKDACNNESLPVSQTINVVDITAPAWTTAATALNVTLQCSDTQGLATAQSQAPVATDACSAVTYTKTSGSFVMGNCANSGTYTNTWIAKDVCLNISTTFTQIITIQDTTAPTWTTAPTDLNATLECSDAAGLATVQSQAPVATDNCNGTVTYTKTSGSFVAGNCANSGTYTNTWIAKDVCLNTSTTFTQVITIKDTTAPIWTNAPTDLNVTLECSDTDGLATAQSEAPIATDNCNGTVTYTKTSGSFVAGSCANSGTYTNTWKAKDVCLNTSTTFTQVITIKDTTAPTWTTEATDLNVTLQCSDTQGLAAAQSQAPIATDNCNGTVTYTKTSGHFVAGSCANSGTYTNTWKAKDVCLNTSTTFTQVITIEDTTAPTWTTAATALNVTLQCSNTAGLAAAQSQAPVATDNCNGTVTYTKTSGSFVAGNCANSGTYTNTWLAKDVCLNTSTTFTQIITIEDTTAPTWTTAATALNVTLQCSDTEGLNNAQGQAPVATDNCSTVTYTKVSGQFQRGSCGSTGTYTNTWTAKDVCNNTSTVFTQVITVHDTAIPTWITQAGSLDITLQCSDVNGLTEAQNQAPSATANCSIVTYIKTSGQFMASESCSNSGTYTNSWIAKDDCGNITSAFTQVITIEDTTKPTWTTVAGTLDVTVQCSDTEALASAQATFPIATDNCDGDVSNIVKTSGQFMASESCSNSGTYTNTWTVKDECGNTSDTFTQVITIEDTTKPTWTTVAGTLDVTIQCSDTQALASAQATFPVATDNCDGDVSNIVKTSGQFMASESCSNSGTYTNTWTVKDDCGNTSDTFTQVITIEDTTKPTWTTVAGTLDVTIQCSDTEALVSAQAVFPVATDNCDGDVSNIVKTSGQFMASESCRNSGTYTNTWTVKDECGNTSDTFTQVITLEDTTKPTFVGNLPADITVSCDAVPAAAEITASDNCNPDLPVVYTETKSGIENECNTNYTLTRTWTTSDCSNNTNSYTQIITVRDTTPPTGTVPADITGLQSIADIPVANSGAITDAADNCSQTVNIMVTDTNNGASGCQENAYILTRTYTLSDCAGNKTILVQTITVENKVSVSGIPTPASCQGLSDGSIAITSSPGATVVVTNANNEVVGNTNLPAGTYTLTASSAVNSDNQNCTATATVTITEPNYKVRISGTIMNIETNTPLANVPVTLIPQGTTTGPILLHLTDANGMYNFQNIPEGNYLLQVQDANLNNVYQLYPVTTNMFLTTLQNCAYQVHNFDYGHSKFPIIGDFVWYDTNSNGIQDEWYDANNDGVVTQNIPDSNNAVDYSKWEWIDFNGDGSYSGPQNIGELNAGGFGNPLSPNIFITGPNGYHKEIIVGIQGYYRDRVETENPFGDYTVELKIDSNLDAASQAMGATGLVKVVPNFAGKKVSGVTGKQQAHIVCGSTNAPIQTATITAEDLIHLDKDFGISCKLFADIDAVDDNYVDIGCNKFGLVGNVLSNDLLNAGTPATIEMVNFTLLNNTGNTDVNITINQSGNVNVPAGTPAGTYTYNYQICEKLNPTNCDSALVTIKVLPNEVATASGSACNADTSPVNLLDLLPSGTPTTGTWIDTNSTHAINGNILTAFGLPLGDYVFEYKIQDDVCPRSIILNLSVNDKCKVLPCGTILVHNAFSPNGDSINDKFIIDSIDDTVCYPSNDIEIYNRWGILVFETKNYNNTTNSFDGISRGRTTISQSDGLPSGTYFYILNYTSVDGNGAIQTNKKDGYLYLSR